MPDLPDMPESTIKNQPVPSPIAIPVGHAGLRAGVTIVTHFVVDLFSFVGVALLPLFAVLLEIPTEKKALLLGLGSLFSGAIQPVVAWASDRYDTRALGTLGFVVAVLCIGNLGMAQNYTQFAIMYCLGAAGIGAYHPPAAAIVGHLGGSKRSMLIAVFFLAGMCGGIAGNVFTPRFVEWMTPTLDGALGGTPNSQAGVLALRWFIPIGLAFAALLAYSIHKVGHRHDNAKDHQVSWDRDERRQRWLAVGVLYVANMMRFSVNMALVYLLVEWTGQTVLTRNNAGEMSAELGIEASQLNGMLQASMQVGMGSFGILLGFLLSARFEKLAFVGLPMLGAIAMYMIPRSAMIGDGIEVPFAIFATVLTGVGFGAVIPVSISLAQRLLPHRTSLASGLMLGGAWMLAFVGPIFAEIVQNGLVDKPHTPGFVLWMVELFPESLASGIMGGMGLNAAFTATAGVLFSAGLMAMLLPHKLIVEVAKH